MKIFLIMCIFSILEATKNNDYINVFIDCKTYCDLKYIKTEVAFVNYVNDITDSDLYIMISDFKTAGGKEYIIDFKGKKRFEGINETLKFNIIETDNISTIREKMVDTIKLGIIRYIYNTDLARHIKITYNPFATKPTLTDDKWKNWLFKTSLSAYFSGERSYKSSSIMTSFYANKITKDIKFEVGYSLYHNTQKYLIIDNYVVSSLTSKYIDTMFAKKLNEHNAIGLENSYSQSTYSNIKSQLTNSIRFEHSIFPYSLAHKKILKLEYKISYENSKYDYPTIFGKTKDNLFKQRVKLSGDIKREWGNLDISISFRNYLYDFNKNSLNLSLYTSLNLLKGLTININTHYAIIRDQIYLSSKNLSSEDILLKKSQMKTHYNYNLSIGLTYRFGSIYSEVINPIFD